MSIELHVLFNGKLPSKAALTRCFKELGFPLAFAPGAGSLEQQKDYLPMRLRGEESGVEFDTYDGRDAVEEIAGKETDPRFTRSANFRLGGDENELTVALGFAAALAKLIDGTVFDPQEGCLHTVEQAIDRAKKQIAAMAPKSKVRGTRLADIKHYLKPLLQMRSDLVLVDRLLLIRPVRHLLRGVRLERTGNEYCFDVRRFLLPLFTGSPPRMSPGEKLYQGAFYTGRPLFEPLLIDRLAIEVFGEFGAIGTLADFARSTAHVEAAISAFVLAGQSDKAAERVEQARFKPRAGPRYGAAIREDFERMTSDVGAHCAECHAKEAELIKAMKLEYLWEPTPFPVELPPDQRDDRTADPSFAVTPWPARPPSLWQDPPQQPGEIRYAQRWYWQGDDLLFLVALTAAEAEERHRTNQVYVLAARLPDNILMSVNHSLSIDFMFPDPERTLPDRYYYIFLQGPSHRVIAEARFELDCRHSAEIKSIDVGKRGSDRCIWSLNVHRDEEVRVRDNRGDESAVSTWSITPADREKRTLRGLAFGSHLVFAERVRLLLQIAGFGELS